VVLGLLDERGCVDGARTRHLVQLAKPLPVTFHRAIDMTPDLSAALEEVIATGASRILTSGGAPNATRGLDQIARMVAASAGRIGIMPGGGISTETAGPIAEATGATEFHSSVRTAFPSPVQFRKKGIAMGDIRDREYRRYTVLEENVRALVGVLEQLAAGRALARSG
jgi:copper homeostasis protein